LNANLTIELQDRENTIKAEISTINELRKRRNCIRIKQNMYFDGKSLEEVDNFICPDDYQKLGL